MVAAGGWYQVSVPGLSGQRVSPVERGAGDKAAVQDNSQAGRPARCGQAENPQCGPPVVADVPARAAEAL